MGAAPAKKLNIDLRVKAVKVYLRLKSLRKTGEISLIKVDIEGVEDMKKFAEDKADVSKLHVVSAEDKAERDPYEINFIYIKSCTACAERDSYQINLIYVKSGANRMVSRIC